MPHCECLGPCTSDSEAMAGPSGSVHAFHDKYCDGNQHACARWNAYQHAAREAVPADLYPHEHERLRRLAFG